MSNGESAGYGYDAHGKVYPYGSLRQSPPKNNALIPTGATISPPESSHNSSDDEEPKRRRGRNLENLAELQAAIRIIKQRKESSPNQSSPRLEIALDALTNAQAFGNRYDLGASFSAAIQNASAILGEQSGLKPRLDTKQSSRQVPASGSGGATAPISKVAQAAKKRPH
jgi:hypothetical protein